VKSLGRLVGISDVQGGLSPEEKLHKVIAETKRAPTLYIGDGINDAPALQAASVGVALGTKSDITSEASDAVILDQSLESVDRLFHIAKRMRVIALQSAIGGMALSIVGMGIASFGLLTPLAGAILQEGIDVLAVLNALRTVRTDDSDRHQFGNNR
jgi:P-type E1-E2 ATPase